MVIILQGEEQLGFRITEPEAVEDLQRNRRNLVVYIDFSSILVSFLE